MDFGGQKIARFNNIELITDRPLAVNLKEIYEVKKRFGDRAVIAFADWCQCERDAWRHEIVKKAWRRRLRRHQHAHFLAARTGCPSAGWAARPWARCPST